MVFRETPASRAISAMFAPGASARRTASFLLSTVDFCRDGTFRTSLRRQRARRRMCHPCPVRSSVTHVLALHRRRSRVLGMTVTGLAQPTPASRTSVANVDRMLWTFMICTRTKRGVAPPCGHECRHVAHATSASRRQRLRAGPAVLGQPPGSPSSPPPTRWCANAQSVGGAVAGSASHSSMSRLITSETSAADVLSVTWVVHDATPALVWLNSTGTLLTIIRVTRP
jgi:hypothetical protein